MKFVKVLFFLLSSFIFIKCFPVNINSLSVSFYNQQADKFISQYDLKDTKLKNQIINYLKERFNCCKQAIDIKNGKVSVLDERLFAREVAYINPEVISAAMTEKLKQEKEVMKFQKPQEKKVSEEKLRGGCLGAFFMLDFARFVEANVLRTLQIEVKCYCKNQCELEDLKKELDLKLVTIEAFNEILNKNYSDNELRVLNVLESWKFANIVLSKLGESSN